MSPNSQHRGWRCQQFLKSERPDLFQAAMAIRTEVFVEEQGVPVEAEQDALDEVAYHYLLSEEQASQDYLATARLVIQREIIQFDKDKRGKNEINQTRAQVKGKIGRVAVLQSERGKGLGKIIMKFMMAEGPQLGVTHYALHAQIQALGFYGQLGFVAIGEPFLEEGIWHRKMVCPVH